MKATEIDKLVPGPTGFIPRKFVCGQPCMRRGPRTVDGGQFLGQTFLRRGLRGTKEQSTSAVAA